MKWWVNMVDALGVAAAALGAIVMGIGSVIWPEGRLVAIPVAALCVYLTFNRWRQLRSDWASESAEAQASEGDTLVSASSLPPNKSLERTREE
jgi:hypothetical protein